MPASNAPFVAAAASPRLLVKVCGMREAASLAAVAGLEPDYLGFIFYAPSPRCADPGLTADLVRSLPGRIQRVGVFVNETTEAILATAGRFGLSLAQLHGQETPAQCAALQAAGLPVMKAFGIGPGFDFEALGPYAPHCQFFLFDTRGPAPGGNGVAFDWDLLRDYRLPVPYFLAGGLRPEHAPALQALHLPGLVGVDVNSGVETAPGVKDPALVVAFLAGLGRPGAAAQAPLVPREEQLFN